MNTLMVELLVKHRDYKDTVECSRLCAVMDLWIGWLAISSLSEDLEVRTIQSDATSVNWRSLHVTNVDKVVGAYLQSGIATLGIIGMDIRGRICNVLGNTYIALGVLECTKSCPTQKWKNIEWTECWKYESWSVPGILFHCSWSSAVCCICVER